MDKSNKSGKEAGNEAPVMFIPQEEYLQSLYAVTRHWHSDMEFFEEELKFFQLLIDKHLMLLIDSRNIEQTRSMVSHVLNLEKDRVVLDGRIILHNQHIADLVENPFVQNVQDFKEEHAGLEVDFQGFVKKFRTVKSEVFRITERVIHSEKVKRVIDWA